uniref:RRM domain-containing protein n=2 Tax=Davidia involucrata TaxID=16924 RepID=A0A5B7AXM9_DAVIN
MAFFSKAGGILRQNLSKHINSEISASNPSIFQMIRSMSSMKLFVGGLSYSTDDTSLKESFNKYGEVVEARVIVDRETGRSRGFGFITFTNSEDASCAIQALDGQDLHGRRIKVNFANDRARGTGFGGSGGGYGGGGGYGDGAGNYGGNGSYGGGGGDSYGSGGGNYGGGYGGNN